MNQKIKHIIFDIGGVLQLSKYNPVGTHGHHTLSIHHYMAKKLKVDLDTWFDNIDSAYAQSIEGTISEKKAISIISKNLGISKEKFIKLFHKAYKKGFKKNIKLFQIAHKLKKKEYKIGILSDQWYLSKDILVKKKRLKGFNPVIVSCDVGMRKPNPKIYRLLIKRCKCKASEILFIDNRNFNLKPAKKLNIRTMLFKDNKQCIRDLKKLKLL